MHLSRKVSILMLKDKPCESLSLITKKLEAMMNLTNKSLSIFLGVTVNKSLVEGLKVFIVHKDPQFLLP